MKDQVSAAAQIYFDKLAQLAPTIREYADRAEREGLLSREVVDAFHETALFRAMLPREMDGGGLTIPDGLRLCEEAARIDGSAGWNLSIYFTGPLFTHNLSRAVFEQIHRDSRTLLSGSLNPMTSEAVKVEGGWRFRGKATYASGSAHASHLLVAAVVLTDGAPRFVDGFPELRAAVFPIKQVKILNTWFTAGMRGTGSNDCAFENVFVPDEYTFDWINAQSPWQHGAFANIPIPLQMVGNLACTVLGIARHALDALNEIAQAKIPLGSRATLRERPVAQTQFAQAEGLLRAARAYFYNCNDEIWRRGEEGGTFSIEDRAHARLAIVTAVKLAVQAIDIVADVAGMNSIQTAYPIERCWRDAHTAIQHVLMNTARFEVVGRVLFGLDPGSPII
jgi:alkylation response protein AidB-like acyl-CoA dehydrogenase